MEYNGRRLFLDKMLPLETREPARAQWKKVRDTLHAFFSLIDETDLSALSQIELRDMWKEFHANINALGPESEQLLHDLFTKDDSCEVDFLERDKVRLEPQMKPPSGSTERTASVRVRRGQQFFRQTVINSYGVCCCISGINVPRLLVASHIKPWRDFPEERLNPRNGLCLSSLHDAAFDDGLITLDKNLCLVLGKRLKSYFPQPVLEQSFVPFEGKTIRLPKKIAEPDAAFLRHHCDVIFAKRNQRER